MSTCCHGSNNATTKWKSGHKPRSKNKPIIPEANYMQYDATLHPHVLKIPACDNVAETIAAFAHGCSFFGVSVLSASGPIAAAVLREASPYPSTRTFQGCFHVLSLTATFVPGQSEGSLAVTLAGPFGQVVGGVVAVPVVAAGTVIMVAATFASSAFHLFGAVNNTSTSILPVFRGGQGCGKTSVTEKCETEKSERDMLQKSLEELEQFLDLSPVVDGDFIGDGPSEEKTRPDGAKDEPGRNMLDNYLKELEYCVGLPPEIGGAFNRVGGEAEKKTAGHDGQAGGDWEENGFGEQYFDLQMVVDDSFGGSRDGGCGNHFGLDAFCCELIY